MTKYSDGLTREAIAAQLGIGVASVYRVLRAAQGSPPRHSLIARRQAQKFDVCDGGQAGIAKAAKRAAQGKTPAPARASAKRREGLKAAGGLLGRR